ncbi:MAG TPA: hypothetical protein VE650_06320, partial [Acetobacteraceae bacterium]|nr:hypothetical protein [Acetobacteraceae bacterium]
MTRGFTLVSMLMAGGSGLFLYEAKHHTQILDREIGKTIKQTEQARERIGLLKAEWTLLNEPDRLAELARAHLNLTTLQPSQFIAPEDLASKLPTPVAPTAPEPTTEPEPEPPPAPAVAQAAPLPPDPNPAAPPPPAPVPLATPAPEPRTATELKPIKPSEPRPVQGHPRQPATRLVQSAIAAPLAPRPIVAVPVSPVPANGHGQARGGFGETLLRGARANSRPFPTPPVPPPELMAPADSGSHAYSATAHAMARPGFGEAFLRGRANAGKDHGPPPVPEPPLMQSASGAPPVRAAARDGLSDARLRGTRLNATTDPVPRPVTEPEYGAPSVSAATVPGGFGEALLRGTRANPRTDPAPQPVPDPEP